MDGVFTKGNNIVRLLSLFVLIAINAQTSSADDRQVVIIKSSDNTYFNQSIETLVSKLETHAKIKIIQAHELNSSPDVLEKSSLVLTLGVSAANNVASQLRGQMVINAYITEQQMDRFKHHDENHITVLLNQPFERYLAFSQRLLNLKTVGTISRTRLSLNNHQEKIREKLGLTLDQYNPGDTNKNLLAKVRLLTKKNEALLMLPDQSIFNRDTLKGILLTAYRSRTPVISYSPGHVKSGALAAIYSSPENIGQHLADLINQYHEGKLNSGVKTKYASYYSIATNQRVAHSLGLDLPDKNKLRSFIDESTK